MLRIDHAPAAIGGTADGNSRALLSAREPSGRVGRCAVHRRLGGRVADVLSVWRVV